MSDYLAIAQAKLAELRNEGRTAARGSPTVNEINEIDEVSPAAVWLNTLRPGQPPSVVDVWLHAVCLRCHRDLPPGKLYFCRDDCRDTYLATKVQVEMR